MTIIIEHDNGIPNGCGFTDMTMEEMNKMYSSIDELKDSYKVKGINIYDIYYQC